jgi:acyl carrier protein
MTTAAEIRAHILAFVSRPATASDEYDLRADGAVDSLRFVQLLADLEARLGTSIDLAEVAPERVTNLGVLSRHIAAQVGAR